MAKLEDLKRGAAVKGILPDCLVTVVDPRWYRSAAIELTSGGCSRAGRYRLDPSIGSESTDSISQRTIRGTPFDFPCF